MEKYCVIDFLFRTGGWEFVSSNAYSFNSDEFEDVFAFADEQARIQYEEEYNDGDEWEEFKRDEAWGNKEKVKYGEKWEGFRNDTYFFFGGEVSVRVQRVNEITKEEFETISKYI